MPNMLDYGRRRSRRHWRVLAVAIVLAVAAFFSVRSWRAYQARLENERLQAVLQAVARNYPAAFDLEFMRQLQSAPEPSTTRASTRP